MPPTNKYYIEIEIYGLINMFAGREEKQIEFLTIWDEDPIFSLRSGLAEEKKSDPDPTLIQTEKNYWDTLYLEMGGYLGIFLGFSLFDLRFIINHLRDSKQKQVNN